MEINGIAHIQLTVNDFAACSAFYRKLFALFEMQLQYDEPTVIYGVGGRTAIAVRPSSEANRATKFDQTRIGLHHLCFRLRKREDIDVLYAFLVEIGAHVVHPPEEGAWAPGYYSVLFEDPDGLRLEANYVPGKGNLDPSITLPRRPPT